MKVLSTCYNEGRLPSSRLACSAACAAALSVALVSAPRAGAQSAVGNLGTLVCTLEPGTREPNAVERQISCNFSPVSGPGARFKGIVKRFGAEIPGERRVVLAWSVKGPTSTSSEQIEGRYIGALESKPSTPAGLKGGGEGRITLQPLAADPSLEGNAAVSIIELEISRMRA